VDSSDIAIGAMRKIAEKPLARQYQLNNRQSTHSVQIARRYAVDRFCESGYAVSHGAFTHPGPSAEKADAPP
jgi:hypothetical protein